MVAAINELHAAYQNYFSTPQGHPRYYEKWVSFWKTRYEELRRGK